MSLLKFYDLKKYLPSKFLVCEQTEREKEENLLAADK